MLKAEHPEFLHSQFLRLAIAASQRVLTADVAILTAFQHHHENTMKTLQAIRLAVFCVALPCSHAQAALLAFYDFNSDLNDRSGNGYDPTVSLGVTATAGYEGSAFAFDGTSSYIQIPLDINPSVYPQLTMGAWVKTSSLSPIRQVISHDNGGYDRSIGMDFRGGGTGWSAFAGSASVLGFQPVVLDQWTFLAVVYDQTAGSVTLYVNGDSFYSNATLGIGNSFTRIGMNPAFGEYFQGAIDNVFLFGDSLSPSEITRIRTQGSAAIVPEPSAIASLALATILLSTGWLWPKRIQTRS